jgi:hypothetical protein
MDFSKGGPTKAVKKSKMEKEKQVKFFKTIKILKT